MVGHGGSKVADTMTEPGIDTERKYGITKAIGEKKMMATIDIEREAEGAQGISPKSIR